MSKLPDRAIVTTPCSSKRHTFFEPVRTLAEDEKKLTVSIAQAMDRLTLQSIRLHACLPRQSLTAELATAYSRLSTNSQHQVRRQVRKSVRRTTPPLARTQPPQDGLRETSIDPKLLQDLRQQFKKRWATQLSTIGPKLQTLLSEQVQLQKLITSTLEMKLAGESSTGPWFKQTQISTPETFDFRWRSTEPGAARCYWQLIGPVDFSSLGQIITAGYSTGSPDVATPGAVMGQFKIALNGHLSPTPPAQAATYYVRVLPLGSGGLLPALPAVPLGIGPWSTVCIIQYGQQFQQGPQQFNIAEVFRKAHFHIDWLQVVSDQSGGGAEEYYLAGFVHHQFQKLDEQGQLTTVMQQKHFGPYFHKIEEGDDSAKPVGRQATFTLNNPNEPEWPRTMLAVITLMESDDGGGKAEWLAALTDIANDMMSGVLAQDIGAFLDQVREQVEAAKAAYVAASVAEAFAIISAAIAASAREYVSAIIGAAVAGIIASIMAGAEDDMYGTHVYSLHLLTNLVDAMEADAAGVISTSTVVASGGNFTGTMQANGSYRLDPTVIQFLGVSHALTGSPIDGIVNISMHWEFSTREVFS